MKLPFDHKDFFSVFSSYNEAIWPAQALLFAVGVFALYAIRARWHGRDAVVAGGLAFLWLWSGIVYHWAFFTAINPAARWFGALFIIQGGGFLATTLPSRRLHFALAGEARRRRAGAALVFYALILYPIIGLWSGQRWPGLPTFGAPCPLTLFTLGMLLWARAASRWLLLIPVLWALIGGSAAFLLAIPEDLMLPIGALMTILLLRPAHVGHSGTTVHHSCPRPNSTARS